MPDSRLLRRVFSSFVLTCLACCSSATFGRESRSLAGKWRFRMDPDQKGVSEKWYAQELEQTIRLPGSMP